MQVILSHSKQTAHQGEPRVLGLALRAMIIFLCSSCTKCTSPNAPSSLAKAGAADAVVLPHVKRDRVTADCGALDKKAELYSARAGHCKIDQDCCLIWDLEFFGCAAANSAEDLRGLRDNIRAQTRNCGRKDMGCQDREPVCRKGRCEMRGARTPDPRGDDEPLLTGLRYDCRQPYTPAVEMLGLKSPGVALLTDPRLDPWFGIELPDGGGYGAQVHVEVCVSEEGSITSVRTLERAPEFPKAVLQDKILDTWQFKPLVVDGNAKPFCVLIGYPMESRN